jgi:hypothetical protein
MPANQVSIAAIAATLLAHQQRQQVTLLQQNSCSPWKLKGRERTMRRNP